MAHGQESHSCAFRWFVRNANTIIAYGQHNPATLTDETNLNAARLAMLDGVGNRLLRNAEKLHSHVVVGNVHRVVIAEVAGDLVGSRGAGRQFLESRHQAADIQHHGHESA